MKKQKICLVCSTGGHLSQMLKIAEELNDYNYFFVTYESTVSSDVRKGYFIKSRFTNSPNMGAIVLLTN
jgi:UDP-N-acetylglucosamine:LPS N-acetylglucosamine transferase